MFTGFHSMLRAAGLQVGVGEWMTVVAALDAGAVGPSLRAFYTVARALVCRDEGDYDRFDQAFGAYFQGTALPTPLHHELQSWLDQPLHRPMLTAEELAALERYDLDALRKLYEQRLREQTERHDGGSKWIGTGGTSPFGQGGVHPTGMRVGEGAPGRGQAIATAKARRFRNYRTDVVLDTRQIAVAIRKLRRLERKARREELDLPATIERTARNGGDIDIVVRPERRNQARVVLLLDAGGSMDPHSRTVETFFSALKQSGGLREVEAYYFHNCPYAQVYTDMAMLHGKPLADVLRGVPPHTFLVAVGDAWMAPRELFSPYGAIEFGMVDEVPGLQRIEQIAAAFARRVWLNPIPENYWGEATIAAVGQAIPMFPLTVEGMVQAVGALMGRGDKRPVPPVARRNPWAAASAAWDV
ncbi:MAG: VWA domain-containing protein [Deltaproteobacteria bacterium]|nr:VWA domain-containing protein [Deltaproteobacteria bacterium]